MEHGSHTYLEVLTTRQSLLSAQLTQVANHFTELQSLVNLYQALGGGKKNNLPREAARTLRVDLFIHIYILVKPYFYLSNRLPRSRLPSSLDPISPLQTIPSDRLPRVRPTACLG